MFILMFNYNTQEYLSIYKFDWILITFSDPELTSINISLVFWKDRNVITSDKKSSPIIDNTNIDTIQTKKQTY